MARQSRRLLGAHRFPRAARTGPALLLLALGCGTETPAGGKVAGTGSTGAAGTNSAGTAGSGGDAGASVGAAGTGFGAGGTSAGTSNSGGAGGGGGVTDASAPTGGGQGGNAGTGGAGGSGGTSSSDGGTGCMGKGNICWDFETGQPPSGWAPITNQGTGSIAVDNTKPHGGMFALHVKGSGSNPMHSLGSTLPPNFGGTMWGRAYLFLSPQGPGDHGATFKARYADATDTAPFTADKLDWYETGLGHGVYETIWHKPQPPSGLPEWEMISNTKVTLNQWFCEEWLFDGVNGTNPEAAEPRMWIDGTELAFPDKHIYPGGAPKPPFTKAKNFILIEVGLIMYHPLTVATDLWMDDLVIGPERIGCN